MSNSRKRKVFDIEPWKKYYEWDEYWTLKEVEPKDISLWSKLSSHRKYFMKFFLEWIQEILFKKVGDDCKYFQVLSECIIDTDNMVMISKFRSIIDLSDTGYFTLLRRLQEKAVIAKLDKNWYMNPIICMRWSDIKKEVWDLFKEKSAMLYWVKEI